MKSLLSVAIVCLCFLWSGCSPVRVNYDYDTNFDFSTLKNYSWIAVPPDFPANEITVQRIKKAVDEQLAAKGFTQVSTSPDFRVSMLGFKDVVTQGVVTGPAYGAYPGYRGYGGYREYDRRGYIGLDSQVDVYQFEEGTLTLTVINAARNVLVWEGTATAILDPDLSVQAKEEKTQEIIAKLLANFPPIPN